MKRKEIVLLGSSWIERGYCDLCNEMYPMNNGRCLYCGSIIEFDEVVYRREVPARFKRKELNHRQKERILEAQDYRCIYCGEDLKNPLIKVHFDHFVPFCFTGSNSEEDFFAACEYCNMKKGARIFDSLEGAKDAIGGRGKKDTD